MTQFSMLDEQISWWRSSLVNYFSWWALVLSVLIIGLGIQLVVYPLYQQWNSMAKADQLNEELKIYEDKYNNLLSQVKEWKKINTLASGDLRLILPYTIDMPNLMAEIDALVKSSPFTLNGIAFTDGSRERKGTETKIESTTGIKTVTITVSVTDGNYSQFKELVTEIESAWRLLELKNVSFVTDDSYTIELASYYYP